VDFGWRRWCNESAICFSAIRKNPGFAFTAIFILSLGMGVTSPSSGLLMQRCLEPLPYAHPDRLMAVDEASAMFRARIFPATITTIGSG